MASPLPHLFNVPLYVGFEMTQANAHQIHLRNFLTECAQSLKKENAGKFYNDGIRDCAALIAALIAK
jgi:hypothetical protein